MLYEVNTDKFGVSNNIDIKSNNIELDFIHNDSSYENHKVINSIEQALKQLKSEVKNKEEISFYFSIAFITDSGLGPILMILKELNDLGIKGKILTTDYLTFSSPSALNRLCKLSNSIELKMFRADQNLGFHTKGYIFCHDSCHEIIIGSSNLTNKALFTNYEWNVSVKTHKNSDFSNKVLRAFNALWTNSKTFYYSDIKGDYEKEYLRTEEGRKALKSYKESLSQNVFEPNNIQIQFINNIQKSIQRGDKKGLLISATGTGKTFASIFGIKKINPKRVLFIVHSRSIAKQAKESFEKVFKTKTTSIAAGNTRDFTGDLVFATFQTLNSINSYTDKKRLYSLDKKAFDFIVIDECHHIGAPSYKEVATYFEPSIFLLGMTATPDRCDNEDVYAFFGNNILLDIRLSQALNSNYLCPFNYYGISDLSFINDSCSSDDLSIEDFNKLVSDERVLHVIKEAEFYGQPLDKLKGLIFCSTIKECKALSAKFNQKGYKTAYLGGGSNQEQRENTIKRLCLEGDDPDKLHYIFTVNIFNEGVDIKPVNQIIMLRATQSSIIFIQQLGRGLRLDKSKDRVVVLDFIANYKNNFLIPVALSSDNSFNKKYLRRFALQPNALIHGRCSVSFDSISEKRILKSIEDASFGTVAFLKDRYFSLAKKLNKSPSLTDFFIYNEIDPICFIEKFKSLHNFQIKYDKEKYQYKPIKEDSLESKYIEYLSRYFAKGLCQLDIDVLNSFVSKNKYQIFKGLEQKGITLSTIQKKHIISYCNNDFDVAEKKKLFEGVKLVKEVDGDISISNEFESFLQNDNFTNIVADLIEFAKLYHKDKFINAYNLDPCFVLNNTYSRTEIIHLLNWEKTQPATNIGGYMLDEKTNTLPIFVNYHKDSNAIKYDDRFKDNKTLHWFSKKNRTTKAKEIIALSNLQENGLKVYLFICKQKNLNQDLAKSAKGQEFFFLGCIDHVSEIKDSILFNDNGDPKKIVELDLHLKTPVESSIYDYIRNKD